MSFLLPVEQHTQFPPVAILAGGTDTTASLTVEQTVRAQLSGATVLSASLSSAQALSVNLAGATDLAAALRIGDEANVFPSAQLDGSTGLSVTISFGADLTATLAGETMMSAEMNVEREEEIGFTFFVDILDAAITTAQSKNNRRYSARLVVDGTSVPIVSARLNAPPDRLGTELSVVLARPDAAQVSLSSSINFDLGIWTGAGFAWLPLLTGGKLSSRNMRYANQNGAPADSAQITVVDVMGDRWNRAPGAHTFLYDPQKIDAPTQDTITSQTIYDRQGGQIAPVYTAISGMRLMDVLTAAYVQGCGFSKVVTNIDNFPVEQAVFSLSGGYDAGVRPLLAMYEPIVFVVDNDLWIITLDNPLPAGFSAREFPASNVVGIEDDLPAREPVSAILVKLKDDGTGEYFTEELETKTESDGSFGSPDYTETDTERRVRKYRNFDHPLTVLREEEVSLKVRVLNSDFQEISNETRRSSFDSLNRPTGYTRTLRLRLPDLDNEGQLSLQTVSEETQTITYTPHPLQPARDVQDRVETRISGLILVDDDNQYLGKPYKIPYLDAHKSGYIDPTASGQTTTFGSIRTIIESMRVQGGQVQRDRRVINHIADVPDSVTTQTLPGDLSFDRRRGARTRTLLLTVAGTSTAGRRVQEFDGTALPQDVAIKLAEKKLQRLNTPPREASVQMAFIDPGLRRGSDIRLRGRSGYVGTYIVRGYAVTIEPNDEGTKDYKMSLNGRELLAA